VLALVLLLPSGFGLAAKVQTRLLNKDEERKEFMGEIIVDLSGKVTSHSNTLQPNWTD
jgi:hypothetical protein